MHGRAIPPVCPAEGLLVAALGQRTMPFSGEGLLDRRRGLELGPFDRAALETLGVPVVAMVVDVMVLAAIGR